MLTILIAAAVLAACAGLRCFLNRPERKDAFFWGGRIRLTALWNDGAAFSLPLKRKLVTALSILILPLVWVFRRRSPIGAGLALGGGLSNLWERLRRGAVAAGRIRLAVAAVAAAVGIVPLLRLRRSAVGISLRLCGVIIRIGLPRLRCRAVSLSLRLYRAPIGVGLRLCGRGAAVSLCALLQIAAAESIP